MPIINRECFMSLCMKRLKNEGVKMNYEEFLKNKTFVLESHGFEVDPAQ